MHLTFHVNSSYTFLGAYSNMEKEAKEKATKQGVRATHHLGTVIEDMIKERRGDDRAIKIFNEMDVNGNGMYIYMTIYSLFFISWLNSCFRSHRLH